MLNIIEMFCIHVSNIFILQLQDELERLNTSTDTINKLEVELDVSYTVYIYGYIYIHLLIGDIPFITLLILSSRLSEHFLQLIVSLIKIVVCLLN